METEQHLNDPWLIAAWPGMGAVAISAGYYMMAKLGMHLLAEFPAREFFDLERVEVKGGLIQTGRLPRSRLFLWNDPNKKHDLIVFIGEAQPPSKGGAFCSQLIGHARQLGVQRVFTFAAMATQMRPEHESHVFGAAIDSRTLADFKRLDMKVLEEGQISGLNGVLLGIAADNGMRGGCLLGEMPSVFSQFPFPKASLAVLKAFSAMQGPSIREIPRERKLTDLYSVSCAFSLPECQEIPTKPTIPKAFPKASMSSRPSRTRATAGTLFTISAKSSSSPSPPCSAA